MTARLGTASSTALTAICATTCPGVMVAEIAETAQAVLGFTTQYSVLTVEHVSAANAVLIA